MMMPARFINLMMKDLRVGGSYTYWLSRMRPDQSLFYSSAEEAAAREKLARRARLKPVADSMLDLPSPQFLVRCLHATPAFLPFYGLAGGDGRIVVADSAGHTLMYHAGGGYAEMLPPTNVNGWSSPISLCITNPMKVVRSEALYAIDRSNSTNFKSLTQGRAVDTWRWLDLPDPPYFSSSGEEDRAILSHTLLGDDNTICFSGGFGTYCYDTYSQEWTKAGSWALPFLGRAVHVPELYDLHFGFSKSNPNNLVALDLSSSPLERPKVLHRWPGFGPPKDLRRWGTVSPPHPDEWSLKESSLLYLGSRRFCIAKWFGIYNGSVYGRENLVDMAATLTGVEIVNAEGNKAKLQMIKHKTRTYIFKDSSIESVI